MTSVEALEARVGSVENQQNENKENFRSLYFKLDDLAEKVTRLIVTIEKRPEIVQPCRYFNDFQEEVKYEIKKSIINYETLSDEMDEYRLKTRMYDEHLREAKENKRDWKMVALRILGGLSQAGILALLGYMATKG